MTSSWNENNSCFNVVEIDNHAAKQRVAQQTYKVIKLKQLASWAGISPTKLLLLRILWNIPEVINILTWYAVEIQNNATMKEDSQAIEVLQLSKLFREITGQVVAWYVTVHKE